MAKTKRCKTCGHEPPDLPKSLLTAMARALHQGYQIVVLTSDEPKVTGCMGFLMPAEELAVMFGINPNVCPPSRPSTKLLSSKFLKVPVGAIFGSSPTVIRKPRRQTFSNKIPVEKSSRPRRRLPKNQLN